MLPSAAAASQSQQPAPTDDQDIAVGEDMNHNEKAQDGDDTESVDSDRTQEVGTEGLIRRAEDYRERKMELGGKPTRDVAEYSKELEQSRITLMPEPPGPRPKNWKSPDEVYYHHYCSTESTYFHHELMGWQSFLRWFRRKWAEQNEALGNSLPPPPPVLEIDPLDLHTQYLGFILLCRKDDEITNSPLPGWNFDTYEDFLEHIVAVEKQVAQMREAQGPDDDVRFKQRLGHCAPALAELGLGDDSGFQEQLKVVTEELAGMHARRAQRQKSSGAFPFAAFLQQAADTLGSEPKPNEPTRKRKHEGGAPEVDAIASTSNADVQDGRAPASKKTKRGRFKIEQHSDETTKPTPTKPRVNTSAKTHDNKAQHEPSNSKANVVETKRIVKPSQKRRGRPSKQHKVSSASDAAVQDKTKSKNKHQGGNTPKVQRSSVAEKADDRQTPKKKAAIAKVQKSKTKVSDSGYRRSARIAEKAKTNLT